MGRGGRMPPWEDCLEGESVSTRITWPIATVALLIAVLAFTVAGCGGGGSSSGGSTEAEPAPAEAETGEEAEEGEEAEGSASTGGAPAGNEAQIAALLEQVGVEGGLGSLPPEVAAGIEAAAAPVTPELEAKWQECMKQTSCETGHGTVTVGLALFTQGSLGDVQNRAEYTLMALRYPQTKKIIFTNAEEDTATAISNFQSLISQGSEMIIGNFKEGAALLPAVRQAEAKKIIVLGATEGVEGAENVISTGSNTCDYGTEIAENLIKANKGVSGGSIAMYTGPPGNPYAALWQPCTKKKLGEEGWSVAVEGNTEWTPAGAQKEASALIASGKEVDGIAYDFTAEAWLQEYVAHNKPIPAVSSNGTAGYIKVVKELEEEGTKITAFQPNSEMWFNGITMSLGFQEMEGAEIPKEVLIPIHEQPTAAVTKSYKPFMPAEHQFDYMYPDKFISQLSEFS
jgi:ABC-type sugar transport system substrate-binding protein